jgi:hypothetical protein
MTSDKILSIAKKEVGTKENPKGSNKVKYNTEYYGRAVTGSAYPWCCAFVWWVFKQAGASKLFYGGEKTAHCITLLSDYKKKGRTVAGDYKPGDLVFFNFAGGSAAKHIGICTAWDGTYITTIDGNTGTDNEANGGAVMIRKRHKKYVVGVARPDYAEGEVSQDLNEVQNKAKEGNTVEVTLTVLKNGSKGDSVRALQVLLNAYGFSCGAADGMFGKNTESAVKKFQQKNGLAVDGCVGAQTWGSLLGV